MCPATWGSAFATPERHWMAVATRSRGGVLRPARPHRSMVARRRGIRHQGARMAAKQKKKKPGDAAEVAGKSCYLLGVWHAAPFEYDERHVYTEPEHMRLCAEQVVNDLRSDPQSGAVGVESQI